MRDHSYDTEFESYLEKQANRHKMYPPDFIWRNIQEQLHGYKKWPALTVIALFVISALVVGTVLNQPKTVPVVAKVNAAAIAASIYAQPYSNEVVNKKISETVAENLSVEQLTKQTIAAAIEKVNESNNSIAGINIEYPDSKIFSINDFLNQQNSAIILQNSNNAVSVSKKQEPLPEKNTVVLSNEDKILHSYIFNPPPLSNLIFSSLRNLQAHENENRGLDNEDLLPFSIPSSKSPKNKRNLSHFDFQFYFTPSISYRRLNDNMHGNIAKTYITGIPYDANYVVDVNKIVRHRAAIGYEVGAAIGYKISERLTLRSGIQFNVRQYSIDAYAYKTEPTSITLITPGNNLDTLNTVSAFRNTPGSSPITLTNRYYELSVPVGLDWRPIVRGNLSWGIAASLQPTYTFDKEPFIITSNLKNYANGSDIMRNWNLNTNIETYLGYTMGAFRWQIGPQFRYQLLPTMTRQYPIREHLLDYGLKIGFVKSLR